MRMAGEWFTNVNPQKMLHVSMKIFELINSYIKQAIKAKSNYEDKNPIPTNFRRQFDMIDLM